MIQKLTNKLTNRKKDNKGFTLVELIVVIVILAILAAILIPGLLRWIDKAKEEQYVLEARNVYLAAEAEVAQLYAAKTSVADVKTALAGTSSGSSPSDNVTRIANLADVKDLTISNVSLRDGTGISDTQKYDIVGMTIEFTSSRGDKVKATLADGSWTAAKTS